MKGEKDETLGGGLTNILFAKDLSPEYTKTMMVETNYLGLSDQAEEIQPKLKWVMNIYIIYEFQLLFLDANFESRTRFK